MSIGKRCHHRNVLYRDREGVWHCQDCGEVMKYDPTIPPDDDYLTDHYYDFDEPVIATTNDFLDELRDL